MACKTCNGLGRYYVKTSYSTQILICDCDESKKYNSINYEYQRQIAKEKIREARKRGLGKGKRIYDLSY